MRIRRTQPKAERLVRIVAFHEIREIDRWSTWVCIITTRLKITRPPSLSHVRDLITMIAQKIHEVRFTNIKCASQVRPFFETIELLAGNNGIARRRARRTGYESMLEQNAFLSQPIEGRRLYRFVSIGTGMRPSPVIRKREEDIWSLCS